MPKVTGIMRAKIDGAVLDIKEQTGKLDTGGMERSPHMAGKKVVGFSESPKPAVFTATVIHTAAMDTDEINGWEDKTLVVETDCGVQWMITNAATTKPVVVSGGGESEFEMQGNPAEQIAP